VIFVGLLGLSVIVVVAIWIPARVGGPRLYRAIALVPLLLTMAVPVPFALAEGGPDDWTRTTVLTVSRAGIALSVVLLMIGAVLTIRAAMSGDRRAAILLALETALAGLPAEIVTAYAILFRLL
jgi:hypothetical protein